MKGKIKTDYQIDQITQRGFTVTTREDFMALTTNTGAYELLEVRQREDWEYIVFDENDTTGLRVTGNHLGSIVQESFDYLVRDTLEPGAPDIYTAINELEELGGPEGAEYIALMESIEAECRARKLVAARNLIEDSGFDVPDTEDGVMSLYASIASNGHITGASEDDSESYSPS